MLAGLAEAIDGLELAVDGAELAEGYRLRGRLDAKLAVAFGEFDDAELWDADGAASATSWLVDVGLASAEAARAVARARALRRLPVTAAAAEGGDLTPGQLDAVVANTRGALVDRFAEQEAVLVPRVARLGSRDAATAMQHWRSRADEGCPGEEPDRHLHVSRLGDGQVVLDGTFDLEAGEVIQHALRLAETRDADDEPARGPARRRADAALVVHQFYVEHHGHPTSRRHRPHVTLLLRADTGEMTTLDGRLIKECVRDTWLCDSSVRRCVLAADGMILDYGRAARTVPPALFAALEVRDRGCRFPGCDRPGHWCEAHHLRHWTEGGETELGNLVLLCSHHHHLLHRRGWEAKLAPDGSLEIARPDGSLLVGRPRGPDHARLC